MSGERTDPHAATIRGDDPALARTLSADDASARGASDPAHDTERDSDGSRPSIVGERPSSTLTAEHPGRYRRVSEIGRGGMGRVILAFDEHLGREVAMKELLGQSGPQGAAVSIGAVARFLREARITGQLEHPSIVPVHELGQRADGTIYYTMKRIRGRSLASVLSEATGAPARLAVMSAFRDVCQAIAYAHARGVVHRDLKPDNVMIGEFGETLVVDWGLAKVRGENDPRASEIERRVEVLRGADAAHTLGGHAIGTPAYMSPEQARGDLAAIDERSDVWGLGAMLFEILTGRAPYRGANALEVLQKVLDERPPRVREVAPDAPPELAAIADRALNKDPSSRYPGAKELADEIAAWQDGRNVLAYEYSSLELVRRFVRRNRAATVAGAAILGATLIATALVARSFVSESAARALAERRAGESAEAREDAEDAARRAEMALAQALLERGERALREGDPSGAAIYAAAALARDPASPGSPRYAGERGWDEETRRAARERVERARSLHADADVARTWAFERAVSDVPARAELSPDGSFLLAPSRGGLTRVELATGERAEIAIPGASVRSVSAFVGAERVLLRAGDASGVYEIASGRRVIETPEPSTAAHAAGVLAILGPDGMLTILDAPSGEPLGQVATRHRAEDTPVLVAPDGSRVAVLGRSHGVAEVWTLPLGAPPVVHDLGGWTRHAAFSPSGETLAVTVTAPDVRLVALADGTITRVPTEAWAHGVAWLDDEELAILEEGEVVVRRARTGRAIDRLHVPAVSGATLALRVAPRRIVLVAVGGEAPARVFAEIAGTERSSRGVGAVLDSIRWDAPRSRVVCVAGRSVIAVELRRHWLGPPTTLGVLPDGAGLGHDLAIAADGTIAVGTSTSAIVIVENDGTVRAIAAGDPERVATITSLAFSPDGRTIHAGSSDPERGEIRRVSRDGAELDPIATGSPVYGIAFSPDGRRIAAALASGTVRILDAERDMRVLRELPGHERLAGDAAFSPDGRKIATADGAGSVRVFDAQSGGLSIAARAHRDGINRVTWSPDGRHLVTAGGDGEVRVLASDTLRTVRIVDTTGSTLRAEMTRDGDVVAHDGARVLRVTAIPPHGRDDPALLLRQAEARAGVRLHGLALVASE